MSELSHETRFFDEDLSGEGSMSDTPEFYDDGFVHVNRRGTHFVFYNGEDRGMLTERDVPRFSRLVDSVIALITGRDMTRMHDGLEEADLDFRVTREDVETHPSV